MDDLATHICGIWTIRNNANRKYSMCCITILTPNTKNAHPVLLFTIPIVSIIIAMYDKVTHWVARFIWANNWMDRSKKLNFECIIMNLEKLIEYSYNRCYHNYAMPKGWLVKNEGSSAKTWGPHFLLGNPFIHKLYYYQCSKARPKRPHECLKGWNIILIFHPQ